MKKLLTLIPFLLACSHAQPAKLTLGSKLIPVSQVIKDPMKCAQAPMMDRAKEIFPPIAVIFIAGAPNWQDQLDGLAYTVGLDVVICGVYTAIAYLKNGIENGLSLDTKAVFGRIGLYLESKSK